MLQSEAWAIVQVELDKHKVNLIQSLINCELNEVEKIQGELDGVEWINRFKNKLIKK